MASHFISLGLNFLICKIGIKIHWQRCYENEWQSRQSLTHSIAGWSVALFLWMITYHSWLDADSIWPIASCPSSCAADPAHTHTYLTASSGLWVPVSPTPLRGSVASVLTAGWWYTGAAPTSSWELVLGISPQLHAQWPSGWLLKISHRRIISSTEISKPYNKALFTC